MRILAVSYALPPALYPQAIQVGRLLALCDGEIGTVCGSLASGAALDHDFGLAPRLAFNLQVGFRPRLRGLVFSIARRFVPFYARSPDEFRPWVKIAEAATLTELRRSCFAPDILVTFGEPMSDHLLGLRLKAKLQLPWIAHFSDPWSDNPFRRRDVLANFVNRHCERRVIAGADRLIFTSRETVDLVMRKYPQAWRQKCAVIPHSFDPALYRPRSESDPVVVVRHLGHFYGHRTPLPLFRALRMILRDQPDALRDVRFDLIGRVPTWVKHHGAFRSLPKKLVRLLPAVSYSESVTLMANSDLLLVIDGPADLSVFLPSKLIEYIGAGVPIYGIVPAGTSANLLQRLGGRTANPRNVEHVAEALLSSLRCARDRRASVAHPPWGDPEVRAEFVAARVARDFSAILSDVVS